MIWYTSGMNMTLGLCAAIAGLCIAAYITHKKTAKAPLMCPRRADCTAVVTGKHSVTFGVPNDLLGILYYSAFVSAFAAVLLGVPLPLAALRWAAAAGVLFSAYLLGVQAFVIRSWCSWCLLSALCAALIFFAL